MAAKRPTVKFLCDEMLARLGRYLRAAGYDTVIGAAGANDRTLLDCAIAENRMLLTRDRAILARKNAAGRVLVLPQSGLDAAAEALNQRLGIDWLRAPFTRCLVDNARLRPALPSARAQLPPRARETEGPLRSCPVCGRLYWPGSHVRRMARNLERWAREDRSGRTASGTRG